MLPPSCVTFSERILSIAYTIVLMYIHIVILIAIASPNCHGMPITIYRHGIPGSLLSMLVEIVFA